MEIILNLMQLKAFKNSFYETFCVCGLFIDKVWAYYLSVCQCFTLMGPLTNKSHKVFYDGKWITKVSKWSSTRRKTEILSHLPHNEFWPICRSVPNQPLKLSKVWKEDCQSVERKINWWLGYTLCHCSWCLSFHPRTALSVMFTTSQLSASTFSQPCQ